ncbi:MAG: SDR family oxidoreductase [Bacilli bacterium]|nr:SDR family oxidoreductase [Bacilli bacterium]
MKVLNKVYAVTGGGNGIGREVVLSLLEKGARVAAIDINQSGLNETQSLAQELAKNLSLHHVDITNLEQIQILLEEIITIHHQIDGILNVAGIIQPFISVETLNYQQIERVMNVNFYGTVYMVKTFLPELRKRPTASIVNVSSMGAFLPVPGQTIYGASKAAVSLFTRGLHSELLHSPIRVTLILPGGVATNISKNSIPESKVEASTSSQKFKLLTPQKAASIIIQAMEKGKYRVKAGSDSKMMDIMNRICPRQAASLIEKKINAMMK